MSFIGKEKGRLHFSYECAFIVLVLQRRQPLGDRSDSGPQAVEDADHALAFWVCLWPRHTSPGGRPFTQGLELEL